jgi:quinol monooxygenase YgiN
MRHSNALAALVPLLCLPFILEATPPSEPGKTASDTSKPVMVIVAYRPRPGKEALLLELTRQHLPVLRAQGLATDRPAYVVRAADGTIVEIFEWKSQAAIDRAHQNPAVAKMWERYAEACEYVPLKSLKEAGDLFAAFEPLTP